MKERVIEQKRQVIDEIKEKINNSQSLVLVDYRGLNVQQLTDLRNRYRNAGVDYKVYKNTMMRFAFKECDFEDFNEFLTGPNAVAFGMEDPVSVAKITNEFEKEVKAFEIKAGIVDGRIIGVDEVRDLAQLPSREVLIAKVLGGFNAPIAGFANVLNGTLRGLVYALNGIKEQKEAQEA